MYTKLSLYIFIVCVMFISVNVNANGPVTIRICEGTVGTGMINTKAQAAEYMKRNPNVKIEIIESPDSATDLLSYFLQLIEAKSGELDVFRIDTVWMGDLSENVLDLNDFGFEDITKNMFPDLVENNTVDGKLVAAPWFVDAAVMHYRKDLLEKYNLEVPETWNDLIKAAYTIQEGERAEGNSDFVGYVWQGEAYEGLTCNALEWIASNGGGTIVSKDKKVTIDNPKAVEALNMVSSWIGTISPEGVFSMKEEESRAVFQSGNAAFIRNWPYVYILGNGDDSAVKGKIDFCAIPSGNDGKRVGTAGGWSMGINRYSKNPEIAADLIKFFVSEEQQKYRAIQGTEAPTIKSLYSDKEVLASKPYFEKLYPVLNTLVNRPATASAPNYNIVSKQFIEAVYSTLRGEVDAQTALSTLAQNISKSTGYPIDNSAV